MTQWNFTDDDGTFVLAAPHRTSALYFPLVNEAGMMSAVTPLLNGDCKTGQNTFLTLPVSIEDLHNTRSARNFWVLVDGAAPWSATGNSAPQVVRTFDPDAGETVTLEAGLLWHRVSRENASLGLRAEVTSIVPPGDDCVELMQVTLTNVGSRPFVLTPTAAIPIYGRSADALRDHRHVTSLLHRIRTTQHGVLVRPTLTFDERGHRPNAVTYAVLGAEADGAPPVAFFPVLEDFIGEGGCLEWPAAVIKPGVPGAPAGVAVDGYEAMGGLRFGDVNLEPGQSHSYVLILAVVDEAGDAAAPSGARRASVEELVARYGSAAHFADWLERTRAYWQDQVRTLAFHTADPRFDLWTRWVAVQPTLRRLMGNSFLPYHDYGRGGRGWRDLWQDQLGLLLMSPDAAAVGESLVDNFAGVRIDGSNATIVGRGPGEFKADRNNIPRVWMDHGAWPLLTVRLYLDQTGDLGFLLRGQTYFKDHVSHRCRQVDAAWQAEQGTVLRTAAGEPYRGSVLEHLLVQHLTAFFNAGAAGNTILLEGADWNDGLDMAAHWGESAAFTALYAGNLQQLAELALALERLGVAQVDLAAELLPLLDTLAVPVDYADWQAKRERLSDYFDSVRHAVSGQQVSVAVADLARDLAAKADWLRGHLRSQEWVQDSAGCGWFNGYYDDAGQRVEGQHARGVRMTLTGQVFALMCGIASDEQARQIVHAADRYLLDPAIGGYRLNTDFGEVKLNLGRAFGFAYGHKENGAMFSHMAVMFANALYRRGLVAEGWRVLAGIFDQSQDFARSRMYPGIPEYFSERGRGMYPWLTGSASWYLLTLVTETFGVQGRLGDLLLQPKLLAGQFDQQGCAGVQTLFAGRLLEVVYHNPDRLDYGGYEMEEVRIDGQAVAAEVGDAAVLLPRATVLALAPKGLHRVDVVLASAAEEILSIS